MIRELPHWTLFEICRVELECGVSGFGETMCYYTWGNVTDEDVARAVGTNAIESMWDDSLGAGLQMALFDAVGRALDTPCWALLGHRVRDHIPVSWWDIDMDGEDWQSECRTAISKGYTSFKTKARPWYDLEKQLDVLTEGLPDWFDLDLDFNAFLLDTARATRVIRAIEPFRNVAILETPIPQADVYGAKRLRQVTALPIAMHYGVPLPQVAFSEDVCDGFVVGGGASSILSAGAAIAAAKKIFWLQLVGTGITAAWSAQLGAVLTHARWPAVNCHQLFVDQLVTHPAVVRDGMSDLPSEPGLGVEINEESIEKYRIEPKEKPYPFPDLLIAIRWPSGGSSYYAHARQYWIDFEEGRLPLFVPGVRLERIENDGSDEWRELANKAATGAVHSGSIPK